MIRRPIYLLFILITFLSACASSNAPQSSSSESSSSSIANIHLPSGFRISVYAQGLKSPRFMAIGPKGVLLVANRAGNSIVAYPAGTSPTQAGDPTVIAENLNDPTSLVMHDGYLYVGETSSVARIALGDDLKAGPVERIISHLPTGGHNTRTVLIG